MSVTSLDLAASKAADQLSGFTHFVTLPLV